MADDFELWLAGFRPLPPAPLPPARRPRWPWLAAVAAAAAVVAWLVVPVPRSPRRSVPPLTLESANALLADEAAWTRLLAWPAAEPDSAASALENLNP